MSNLVFNLFSLCLLPEAWPGRKDDRQFNQSHRECISDSRNRPFPKLSTRLRWEANPKRTNPKARERRGRGRKDTHEHSTARSPPLLSVSLFFHVVTHFGKASKMEKCLRFWSFLAGKVTTHGNTRRALTWPPRSRGRGVMGFGPQRGFLGGGQLVRAPQSLKAMLLLRPRPAS